ncbi:hypothetical protein E8P77_20475 [Soehngenia saccharolytica]|nr:hypothetical protein E8P77_20475 [Soehngenia saccharolytica]
MNMRKLVVEDNPSFEQEVYEFGENHPKLMITAGIHGDEVAGISIAYDMIEFLNNTKLKNGSIKIMPKCNPVATRVFNRTSFYDEVDMNRIFPGNETDGPTHKAAKNVWDEACDMDIIIDLHCANQYSIPYILSIYDKFPEVLSVINHLPLENLVQSSGLRGQFFVESNYQRNQNAFIIELPSGSSKGAIKTHLANNCFDALKNLLIALDFIDGKTVDNPPTYYGEILDIKSPVSGLFKPTKSSGDVVNKGDIIGKIGNTVIKADNDSKIHTIMPDSYVYKGDLIYSYIIKKEIQALDLGGKNDKTN